MKNSRELRNSFLKFFEKNNHKIIPSSSLIPENDPSVLYTTAGMQQFKPYYTFQKDPLLDFGTKNVASVQKCLRTSDIEEVGDESHLTFFEMLGNFSFGGYFKEEAIKLAYEFIIKELSLKIDYVSVFSGSEDIPPDKESEEIWKKLDSSILIKKSGIKDNFWGPTGDEGPCGPTTEIYIDGIEVWNIVFNQYFQDKNKNLKPLEIKGIDTGMGLERLLKIIQGTPTVFETDIFLPLLKIFENIEDKEKEKRIICDHLKASIFLLADGVLPSNTDRGYILRRLIRRAVVFAKRINFSFEKISHFCENVFSIYSNVYNFPNKEEIKSKIIEEIRKFEKTLSDGLKHFEEIFLKKGNLLPEDVFFLYQTYGFPLEIIKDLLKERGKGINEEDVNNLIKEHKEKSRQGLNFKFTGGLLDDNPKTIALHTIHHILLSVLQELFGKTVKQRGSNINRERLRIDFSLDRKISYEEREKIEKMVNQRIEEGFDVERKELRKEEAEKLGAEMEFGSKYGDIVSVYFIKDKKGNPFSIEFCGGPHVKNHEEVKNFGRFKIIKEEAVAQGIRRIKATLV